MTLPLRAPTPLAHPWTQHLCTLTPGAQSLAGHSPEHLQGALEESCALLGLTVLRTLVHRFQPQGVSILILGPTLRLALHTWPEHELATLDLVGPDARALALLVEALALRLGSTVGEATALTRWSVRSI